MWCHAVLVVVSNLVLEEKERTPYVSKLPYPVEEQKRLQTLPMSSQCRRREAKIVRCADDAKCLGKFSTMDFAQPSSTLNLRTQHKRERIRGP